MRRLLQAAQVNETLSTCRFAQRMLQVTEDAQQNKGGLTSVHGNLFKLDPVMQQYLEVTAYFIKTHACSMRPHDIASSSTLRPLCHCSWSRQKSTQRRTLCENFGNRTAGEELIFIIVQQMTASAVAREKAQLYAEFSRLQHSQGQELDESEFQELEALRHKYAAIRIVSLSCCSCIGAIRKCLFMRMSWLAIMLHKCR